MTTLEALQEQIRPYSVIVKDSTFQRMHIATGHLIQVVEVVEVEEIVETGVLWITAANRLSGPAARLVNLCIYETSPIWAILTEGDYHDRYSRHMEFDTVEHAVNYVSTFLVP